VSLLQKFRDKLAERRTTKTERVRKRAEAATHRLEMKRRHESDPRGGGGGGG
jgi:hypothetical protein